MSYFVKVSAQRRAYHRNALSGKQRYSQARDFDILTSTKIIFWSQGFRLTGILQLPETPKPPVVIGSHGLFGTSGSAKQVALANACVAAGIGYLRFDHRGCGHSQGDFDQVTTLEGRVKDIVSAVKVISVRADTSDIFGFFGSSLGGTTCISAAGLTQPAAVVVCAAPVRSRNIDPGSAALCDTEEIKAPLRPSGLHFDISGKILSLHDVLLFHGDVDEVVPYNNAGEIFAAASEPKKFFTLPGGDHRMTDAAHQKLFIKETVTWFKDRLLAPDGSR